MKGARRLFVRSGYRLTVRYGRIYTICATGQRQPNTAAQREARAIFAEANRRAVSELQSEARREYWTEKARQRGYKTAIGACRAYHIGMVREEHEARKVSAETVTRNATAKAKRGTLRRGVHNVTATMRREHEAARIWATPKRSAYVRQKYETCCIRGQEHGHTTAQTMPGNSSRRGMRNTAPPP